MTAPDGTLHQFTKVDAVPFIIHSVGSGVSLTSTVRQLNAKGIPSPEGAESRHRGHHPAHHSPAPPQPPTATTATQTPAGATGWCHRSPGVDVGLK